MQKSLFAALLVLPLIAFAPALAEHSHHAPVNPATKSKVAAGTYTMDANHSLIGWRVNHFGISDYFGIFGSPSGTLIINPANLAAAKVDVTIPVAKVTTASEGLTGHLLKPAEAGKKADFFGANPANARFVSTAVTPHAAQGSARITGNLTLNGITKPVTLDTMLTGAQTNPMNKKPSLGFHATTTIKRSDFGINYALPMVSDEVKLDIVAAFEK